MAALSAGDLVLKRVAHFQVETLYIESDGVQILRILFNAVFLIFKPSVADTTVIEEAIAAADD